MEPVTHVIEFLVNTPKDQIKKLCANSGLIVDPNYSLQNGGVTYGLKITGPLQTLKNLVRRCGYPGQNPELEERRELPKRTRRRAPRWDD